MGCSKAAFPAETQFLLVVHHENESRFLCAQYNYSCFACAGDETIKLSPRFFPAQSWLACDDTISAIRSHKTRQTHIVQVARRTNESRDNGSENDDLTRGLRGESDRLIDVFSLQGKWKLLVWCRNNVRLGTYHSVPSLDCGVDLENVTCQREPILSTALASDVGLAS